jgi:predicted signal transduction protein with EAL and GGDEF domain/DNA-binding response OmpR family regulator
MSNPSDSSARDSQASADKSRVLLVDANVQARSATADSLREAGFQVLEADSGARAMARMAISGAPDAVILSARLPGIDGFETCRELRALPGVESVPVVMLIADDDAGLIERSLQAGATDFAFERQPVHALVGRLRFALSAARIRQSLERARNKLARAQDLARMGSLDWRRKASAGGVASAGELNLSAEGVRVFGIHHLDASVTLRQLLRLVPVAERHGLFRVLQQVQSHHSVLAVDVPVVLYDGRRRIVHVEAEPEFDDQGNSIGYAGIVQDVTDRRSAEDRIRHLANFDALTGLPNRRQLIWRIERALEHGERLGHEAALLLIDLDRFKVINDTLGHAAGDDLLVEVARRLRACVRHSDQIADGSLDSVAARSHRSLEAVGRLGGDEFVALLPEIHDQQDAERVAQRVLLAMRSPIFVGGQECFVTASVGIAIFPRDGQLAADLLRNSDVAMYSVKSAGRNSAAIYSRQLTGSGREKLELESALHKAIERNEIELHYQPKVDVATSKMVGAEALMRWNYGGRIVPPIEFIPLAEEAGLITPLSEWAVREAARQARAWQISFGFDNAIAVNLPNRLFERSDLAEHIHEAVSAHGLSPNAIQLEITETGLMKDLQNVVRSLHRLNEIGVNIAIDDFGTGYSSLAYLTALPISELKIDRSFVRDLGVTPQSSAVVTAIIALARSLNLRVVGEGVENLRQMDVLRRLGCNVMQGFLFSRPVPPGELERWLHEEVITGKAHWIDRNRSDGEWANGGNGNGNALALAGELAQAAAPAIAQADAPVSSPMALD